VSLYFDHVYVGPRFIIKYSKFLLIEKCVCWLKVFLIVSSAAMVDVDAGEGSLERRQSFVLGSQPLSDRLVHLNIVPGWLQGVGGGVSAPAVADHGLEPALEAAQVIHVVNVGLAKRDVADKVLEAGLLLVNRLHFAAVVVQVTVIGGHLLMLHRGWRGERALSEPLGALDEGVGVGRHVGGQTPQHRDTPRTPVNITRGVLCGR